MSGKPFDISGKEPGVDEEYLEEKLEDLEGQAASTTAEESAPATPGVDESGPAEAGATPAAAQFETAEPSEAGPFDLDGDGVSETYVGDDNADGVVDITYSDYDGDGYAETSLIDSEFDGSLDTLWIDLDGDLYADILISLEPVYLTDSTGYETATYSNGFGTDVGVQDWVTTSESVVFDWEYTEGPFDEPVDVVGPVDTEYDWLSQDTVEDWEYWESSVGDEWDTWDTWDYPEADSWDTWDSSSGYETGWESWDTTESWDSVATDNWAYDDSGYDTGAWDDAYSYDAGDVWDSGTWDTWDDAGTDADGYWTTDYDMADHDAYESAEDMSWDFWNASVDASVAGDDEAANMLNDLSLDSSAVANDAWSDWMTGTDTWVDTSSDSYSYDSYDTYDSSYSYDSYDSYDTGDW